MTHVLFDMNGTLLDPSSLSTPLGGSEADRELIQRALGATITAAMAETLSAREGSAQPPFTDLLAAALRRELELIGRSDEADAVIDAAADMSPFPEAHDAIDLLREAGIGTGVLTNSPTATARSLIGNSGLPLDPVLGSDLIGAFKPHPDVYGFAVAELGLDPRDVWLVAAHWWDVTGAQRAGLRGAWISRSEEIRLGHGPAPDAEGADLLEVAEAIRKRH